MKESSLFSPEEVLVGLIANNVDEVLRASAITLGSAAGMPSGTVYGRLRQSEDLGSTANPAGFAIPHAFLPKLHEPLKLLMVLRAPVFFGSQDAMCPVDVIVTIIWPVSRQQGFLPSLARHSRIFGNSKLLERLRSAANDEEVIAALAAHSRGTPAMRSGSSASPRANRDFRSSQRKTK